jgi:superfamily II DNA or RNA helicase
MAVGSFQEVIEHLSSFSLDKRGSRFEEVCKWFLENDPGYAQQIKKVWLWKDWPGKWGRDKGIDLIAETYQGKIWAIQAKAYDSQYYVTKEDIDSFLSESSRQEISFRLLIATTNNIGPNAREVIKGQEKPVSLLLLDKLEESVLDWQVAITKKKLSKRIQRTPFDHQKEAIQKIIKGFENSDRGQVHMACGTGKTLVGLWVAEEIAHGNVLVLVPSISLVAQLYQEWVQNRSENFNFDPIFICSDATVYNKNNEIFNEDEIQHLGFPVTTNATELLEQLNATSNKKVVFSTYHSSPVIQEACAMEPSLAFDIAIADEAHRCAGKAQSDFATVTDAQSINIRKRLFMTATPKFFSEHVKKKTAEIECEIVSMDDEEKFGPVLYKLPFSDAIKKDLLSDYQVLISIMDNKEYQEYAERGRFVAVDGFETDARTLASQILIIKAIKKFGLKKVISFHNKKSAARDFIKTLQKACMLLPKKEQPNIKFLDSIFGEMPQDKRRIIMNQFKESTQDEAGILANVKCLSEGVDVPSLDAVAFVDPKGSEIDIIQAVGRAIRKSPDKKIGTIIIPLFIDNVVNEDEALESSCFKTVWQVLKALRAHDDILAEELDTIRLELGKRKYRKPPKLSKIIIDLPVKIDRTFAKSINLKIIKATCGIINDWVSFEEAREFARSLGLRNDAEWREYIAGKKTELPPIPNNIPKAPWAVYAESWINLGDFLGNGNIAPRLKKYLDYDNAAQFAHSLNLERKEDWFLYVKGMFPELKSLPENMPASPDKTYRRAEYGNKWKGWGSFLGTNRISNQDKSKKWKQYSEAQMFVKSLNLKTAKEWNDYINGLYPELPLLPIDIPKKPEQVYVEWVNWPIFLGNVNISKYNCKRNFWSFSDARKFVHKLGLKNQKDWQDYCGGKLKNLPKKPLGIPSNPQKKYKNNGWKGLADWLGKE